MKNFFTFIFCMSLTYSATSFTMAQSIKSAATSKAGTATAATLGGYILPAGIISACTGNFLEGFEVMIPSFIGVAIGCLLQQKGVNAKWGCNTETVKGNILTASTFFACAALVDFVWNAILGKTELKSLGRAALSTIGAYAALATRDFLCK